MKDYFGVIKFGEYPQGKNGEIEKIEWLILDKIDGYMLLLSKNILDYLPTNKKKERVTWETCSIRKWLNNEFVNKAFNDSERSRIADATLGPDTTFPDTLVVCNETEDRIALMKSFVRITTLIPKKSRKNYLKIATIISSNMGSL